MSVWEREGKLHEEMLKLHEEGAIDVRLSIKTDWSNDIMNKIVDVLAKAKINHFKVARTVLHPTKDIEPNQHEKRISVFLVASPLKIKEVIAKLQKIAATEIDRIQAGFQLFQGWSSDQASFLLKEEEP